MTSERRLRRIRLWLAVFIVGLVLSGVTAFLLTWELGLLVRWFGQGDSALAEWLRTVHTGLVETDRHYPFLAYGTDWLAFAHLVIAVAFIGPWRDPVKNIWVIEFGLIACAMVLPLALIAGPLRGIPFGWRLIDCAFGVFGAIPLWVIRQEIRQLY
ncbi:hypothetical protein [Armatimonas rosea]|uniref:Uncharacterized protein n=1 Tax=Armatimonas rosea TaxID=685828 RepID=A0A7W9SMF6_ARMRO|nr:hypothetical protein [Armatimonas rosea]MBB6049342.1 hypothetical protein [Armatimonas rosea]